MNRAARTSAAGVVVLSLYSFRKRTPLALLGFLFFFRKEARAQRVELIGAGSLGYGTGPSFG